MADEDGRDVLGALIGVRVVVLLVDGRLADGVLMCTDRKCNLVLGGTTQYLPITTEVKALHGTSMEERTLTTSVPTTIPTTLGYHNDDRDDRNFFGESQHTTNTHVAQHVGRMIIPGHTIVDILAEH